MSDRLRLGASAIRVRAALSRPGPPAAPPTAGFTLLELLIVVVMLGLVYGVVMPPIARARLEAAVHNARYEVVSTISLARATAIRYGRRAVLRIDAEGDRLWIEVDTTVAATGAVDTLGLSSLGADLRADLQSNRSALCFDGRGIGVTGVECPNTGARIVVKVGERVDTVRVSPSGWLLRR